MGHVFVSYSIDDRAAVGPILDAVARSGLDVRELEGLVDGQSNLDTAECVVVFWSNAAAKSDSAQQQIGFAIQAWTSGRLVLATLDDVTLPPGTSGPSIRTPV